MSAAQDEQRLGKYIISRELGRGGFATVYLARDTLLRRDVALKLLHPSLLTDPAFVTRFENDARATAQLDHPRIATIYELGHYDGRLYMAVQLLPGGSLAERVQANGRLPFDEAVRVVEDVAAALDHAHAAGFVHRDVKPSNILFNGKGRAVLTDFGLVKAAESSVIARTTIGGLIGTPPYMAPEIWEGTGDGPAADVYALGCVLFEMLTGELLFAGATPPAVMLAHFQPHRFPQQWPAGVPAEIAAVLERALARGPSDRFASAGALAEELRALAARSTGPKRLGLAPENAEAQEVVSRLDASPQPDQEQPAVESDQAGDAPASTEAQPEPAPDQLSPPAAAPAERALGQTEQLAKPGWRSVAAISAAWAAGWIASAVLAVLLESANTSSAVTIIGWAAGWAAAGLLAGLILRRWAARGTGIGLRFLAVGWAVCMSAGLFLAVVIFTIQPMGGVFTLALGGSLAGVIAGLRLRRITAAFSSAPIALLAAGWGLGWFIVEALASISANGVWQEILHTLVTNGNFRDAFGYYANLSVVTLSAGGAVGGALGTGLVAWALRRGRRELPAGD